MKVNGFYSKGRLIDEYGLLKIELWNDKSSIPYVEEHIFPIEKCEEVAGRQMNHEEWIILMNKIYDSFETDEYTQSQLRKYTDSLKSFKAEVIG